MIRRFVAAVGLALVPLVSQVITAATAGTPCANLAALTIPSVTVNAATAVAAGPFTLSTGQTAMTLPAFCRVEVTARPTTDSEIKFEVWIPPVDVWNGKFQGVGNAGYQGSISYAAMANALRAGYATASTDTGHTGDDMAFGQGHPEKLIDYGHRAVHVMTESAKLVIRNATGRFAERSYFVGCSAGGQQALSEAQRYPDDYDGIVAGAPANNRIRQTFGLLSSWLATHSSEGKPLLSQPKLALLTKSAVEACDANDGLKDGLIDDPRRCRFDPAKLACKAGSDDASCLTALQIDAAKKMYEGTRNPRTGELIYTGWPIGSESFGTASIMSWRMYVVDPPEPMRVDFFRYWLFHNPIWDYNSIDWERDLAYAEQKLPFMAAVEKDLTPFKKSGAKLLMYTGWADPVVPPQDTIAYYDGVVKAMGGLPATRDFYRFFLAPGMGHCSGGTGPNTFDAIGALEKWVEKGLAPDKLIATHSTGGKVDRSRPLCPYPQVARYRGTGSTDEAENFSCVSAATTSTQR